MRPLRRSLLLAVLLAGLLAGGAQRPEAGRAGVAASRAQAQRLRAAVQAESARIARTSAGLAAAQARLAALDRRVAEREARLADAQERLVLARVRLTRLQRRAAEATATLRANVVADYKSPTPDVVTVVLDAHGFQDLLDRVGFYRRVARRNAQVLDATRRARADADREAAALEGLRARYGELAEQAVADRDRADVLRDALLRRQAQQLRARAGTAARLRAVRSRITELERRQAAAARAAAAQATATRAAPTPAPSPGGGDDAVAHVIAAANQIATTPYVWGGGHGGGAAGGYDCSGSISYALAAGGLLSAPLDSTGFESWGDPGVGRRITVYANAGHAFMVVDGRRYDTSALSAGGTRWSSVMRSTAGFVARHPPGL